MIQLSHFLNFIVFPLVFAMLSFISSYFPDSQLMSDGRGYDQDYLRGLSALKVRIPQLAFGTRFVHFSFLKITTLLLRLTSSISDDFISFCRTQSIVLVDYEGKVTFIERTIGQDMLESSVLSTQQPPSMRSFQFRIRDSKSIPLYSLSRL